MAAKADRYDLYLQSVQSPEYEVDFFDRVFRTSYKRKAELLREDFCGAAAVCAEWVRKGKGKRRAIGVDYDPEPQEWGKKHIMSRLTPERRKLVKLIEGDVRDVGGTRADIIAAQNFATNYFFTRDDLREYFESARKHLKKEGVLVLDCMGGSETYEDDSEEVTEYDGFDYVWENRKFDPITSSCEYAIHFRFPDGSEIEQAFHYEWRLWTIPEICELLLEAGFRDTSVYWESTDLETGEGNGVYRRREHAEADPAWVCYIVGIK
jgi:cyclopropane fatty-acyl-phospholipid synthase-like methyltransferase